MTLRHVQCMESLAKFGRPFKYFFFLSKEPFVPRLCLSEQGSKVNEEAGKHLGSDAVGLSAYSEDAFVQVWSHTWNPNLYSSHHRSWLEILPLRS